MARPSDTLVFLGKHAGFEDWLRASRKVMMAYLWAYPALAIGYFQLDTEVSGKPLAWILLGTIGALLLLKATALVIRLDLVLDRERQQLLLRRRFFFFEHLVSLAGVEELWAVITAGEIPAAPVNYWWDYVTLLITRSGQRFRASRHGTSFDEAELATDALGEQLGIKVLPSQPERLVKVCPSHPLPVVTFKRVHLKAMDCLTVVFWAFMIFLTPILTVILLNR